MVSFHSTGRSSWFPFLSLGSLGLAPLLFIACGGTGTLLRDQPPVALDIYLPITAGTPEAPLDTDFGAAQVLLTATDQARCPLLSRNTVAKINRTPLELLSDGGTDTTKSGTPFCASAQYYADLVPLGGDAAVTLSDFSATFRIVAAGALAPGTISVVSSAEGLMHLGEIVQIGIPARGRTVRYASISFIPDGERESSFSAATPGAAGLVPASVSGDVVSFTVPTSPTGGTLSTGHGTLYASLVFENQVTTCDGPVTCSVVTQMVETVAASLLD